MTNVIYCSWCEEDIELYHSSCHYDGLHYHANCDSRMKMGEKKPELSVYRRLRILEERVKILEEKLEELIEEKEI